MLTRLRALLPPAVKRPLRRVADLVHTARRRAALRRGVATLRKEALSGSVTPAALAAVRAAWGNTGYSADVSFLAAASARVLAGPGPWLECGSGVSTVVLGVLAEVKGGKLWSLEQDAAWCDHVAADLRSLNLGHVVLWHAPLHPAGECVWYELGDRTLPASFAAVFCDGPSVEPGEWPAPLHAAWRMGVVPALQERGVGFGEILLDDSEDPRCAALRRRWEGLGLTTEEVMTPTGGLIRAHPTGVRAS